MNRRDFGKNMSLIVAGAVTGAARPAFATPLPLVVRPRPLLANLPSITYKPPGQVATNGMFRPTIVMTAYSYGYLYRFVVALEQISPAHPINFTAAQVTFDLKMITELPSFEFS